MENEDRFQDSSVAIAHVCRKCGGQSILTQTDVGARYICQSCGLVEAQSLRNLIGCGYDEFWKCRKRYRVIKGSRGSKKSFTIAYWIIVNMVRHPLANTLVVRKVADTLRDSVYATLNKVIQIMGQDQYWKATKSPMEITYLPTGQKILFRGMDDVQKLASMQVTYGVLCWCWIEEAFEITNESDFDRLDQSIRGRMPKGLWKSIILSFNPWNKGHWLRTKFFEHEDGTPIEDVHIFTQTTNYMCNEWLDEADYDYFERMKILNPRLYDVAGLGHWGNPEGLIYEKWEEVEFDYHEIAKKPGIQAIFGLDFGYSVDPSALICALVDPRNYEIWVFDELYEKGLTNRNLARRIIEKGYGKEYIICDSANPKDISELGEWGVCNCRASYKFPGSIVNGISRLQDYMIHIHPRCPGLLTEIACYSWYVNKDGITENKPQPNSMDHSCDALRYAMESVDMGNGGFLMDTELEERYKYPVPEIEEPEPEPEPEPEIDYSAPTGKRIECHDPTDDFEGTDHDDYQFCYST